MVYESPKYSFSSFLSALGGALSLFQGITLVAVFEFFELIVRIIVNLALTNKSK